MTMKKIDSLIYLVKSLSKSEKKHISTVMSRSAGQNYAVLYRLIAGSEATDERKLRAAYKQSGCGETFDVSVSYLYEKILDRLEALRRSKDPVSDLLHWLTRACIFYERDMYNECFRTLKDVIREAKEQEAFEVMLLALDLLREYSLGLDFPDMTEQDLFHIHFIQKDVIKDIQKITEQSSLFDLLKYRMLHTGNDRQDSEAGKLNDLAVREFYITASFGSRNNIFKVVKNHKLFQANYMMAVGETSSALDMFCNLASMFETSGEQQTSRPIYYLSVLESILYTLRSNHDYDGITFFRQKLETLSRNGSKEFKANVMCLHFLYGMFASFDAADYTACLEQIRKNQDIFSSIPVMGSLRKSELLLYTALTYAGTGDYHKAQKILYPASSEHDISFLPIVRIIRLAQLIIHYELGYMDLLHSEIRSIRHRILSKKEPTFKTERLMLEFLYSGYPSYMSGHKINKIETGLKEIRNDKYENKILVLFDFTAWIESKIYRKAMAEIIKVRHQVR